MAVSHIGMIDSEVEVTDALLDLLTKITVFVVYLQGTTLVATILPICFLSAVILYSAFKNSDPSSFHNS